MKRILGLGLATALLAIVVLIGFRTVTAAGDIPQVTIHAKDFSYEAPAQINAGLVSITLVNDGQEPHQAQLARLNDGVTMDQLTAALKTGPEAALPLVTLAGGPNAIDPGQKQQVIVKLASGNYVILCFVSGSDNVPHLAKGMIAPLQVVASAATADVTEPTSDGTVNLKDFTIEVPTDVAAGSHVWKIVNNGPQPHEFILLRLKDGVTMDDFMKLMQSQTPPSGPLPFDDAGGFGAIATGQAGWMMLDLNSGNYVALCFVPDPASGKAHAELGMVTPFVVK